MQLDEGPGEPRQPLLPYSRLGRKKKAHYGIEIPAASYEAFSERRAPPLFPLALPHHHLRADAQTPPKEKKLTPPRPYSLVERNTSLPSLKLLSHPAPTWRVLLIYSSFTPLSLHDITSSCSPLTLLSHTLLLHHLSFTAQTLLHLLSHLLLHHPTIIALLLRSSFIYITSNTSPSHSVP